MKSCPNVECSARAEAARPAELVDTTESCPVCGATLVATMPGPGEHSGESLVLAGRLGNAAAIGIAEGVLTASQICYSIQNEGLQDLFGWGRVGAGFSIAVGAVEFWVPQSQAQEAAEILTDLERELAAPGSGEGEELDCSDLDEGSGDRA